MTTTDTRPTDLRGRMAAAMREAFDQWAALGIEATRGVTREDFFAASALAALEQADVWVVPKVAIDDNPHVRPRILSNGLIRRDAGDSSPEHIRQYVGQLLAAVDVVDAARAKAEGR